MQLWFGWMMLKRAIWKDNKANSHVLNDSWHRILPSHTCWLQVPYHFAGSKWRLILWTGDSLNPANCQAQLLMEAPVQQWWRSIGGSGGTHFKWLLIVGGRKVYLLYKIFLLLLMYFTFSYLFLFPCYFGHVALTWVHVLAFLYSMHLHL